MPHSLDAFALIVEMLRRASGDRPPFPPTELFSEGWMLRLLMEAAFSSQARLPFGISPGASWYSEARLGSAFRPRHQGDPHGEGLTSADGVVGHFTMRADTAAGLTLLPTATQFVVIEAKMSSRLASRTTRVPWFDQAARSVAAMIWTIHGSGVLIDQLESLGFYVFVPRHRLDQEPTFVTYMSLETFEDRISRRLDLYADDPVAVASLDSFRRLTVPAVLERLEIRAVTWEDLLDEVATDLQPALREFYADCLRHNRLT